MIIFARLNTNELKKRVTTCCKFLFFYAFQISIWKAIFAFSFLVFSVQFFQAQKVDSDANGSTGEIFVKNDALFFNGGEVVGKIIYEFDSDQKHKGGNKSQISNNKRKEKTKLVESSEDKEKKKLVKVSSKINYNYFPTKNSESFSARSSKVSCAVNHVEHFLKKAKGKLVDNKVVFSSFTFGVKEVSINKDYVNNYKLSSYLRTAVIRPPPIS